MLKSYILWIKGANVMVSSSKKELFNDINEMSFMLDDITLYLNTHPTCQNALNEYQKFKELRQEAIYKYTEKYGPICRYDVSVDNYWSWVNMPWPWEKECEK